MGQGVSSGCFCGVHGHVRLLFWLFLVVEEMRCGAERVGGRCASAQVEEGALIQWCQVMLVLNYVTLEPAKCKCSCHVFALSCLAFFFLFSFLLLCQPLIPSTKTNNDNVIHLWMQLNRPAKGTPVQKVKVLCTSNWRCYLLCLLVSYGTARHQMKL